MKKILFVGHFGKTGGAGISMLRTARAAVDAGFEVKLCLPAASPMAEKASAEGFSVAEYVSQPGAIEYYSGGPPLYRRTYFKKALRQRPFANEILKLAKDFGPDAVVLNSVTTSFMIPHLKKAGFRTGIFVRETFPEGGSKHMLKRYRKLLSGASAVYFISDHDRDFYVLTGTRTRTVRNSVPDVFFDKVPKQKCCEALGLPQTDGFRILYLGGCDPIKGAAVIAECSKLLPENIEIVACGSEKTELEKLFGGAACKVSCIGVCNDMRSAYGACDAAVIPIVKAHQARPLFEAGAAGLPVIISDFPEISEYVDGGENALTVTPGNARELCGAVLRLCREPELRDKIALANYERALRNHSNSAVHELIAEELARLTGPSVLYVTNIPSPYRVDFFSEMNKKVNVTALFERASSKGREKSWFKNSSCDFPYVIPKGIRIGEDKALNPSVKKLVADTRFSDIVLNGYSSPTEMLAIRKLRRTGRPYTMWIDGGFKKEYESGSAFKIKKYFISGAAAYLSPSEISDEYLTYYGARPERIVRYPFTSIYKAELFEKPASEEEKKSLRDEFGLPKNGRIAVAVGSFIRRKGFLELIKAAALCPELTVVICGGDPTDEYVELINSRRIRNVRFIGFLKKDRVMKLYRACDLFVLPTREDIWGLVVNEAMACGLPVITTDMCVAGLTLVKSGVNGLIIKSGIVNGVETPGELERNTANALKQYCALSSEELYLQGEKAIEVVSSFTIEECVDKHLSLLN
ncbi:MAG: glycosyltransferase family 4 protein [Clostridia bacterium]|nr:glycosyltransferase family 4 protein [Clostridia bacterium]